MIIVTGSVNARPEHAEEVERLSLEHVARSRAEPGCLLHSVHRDVEDTHRFVFVEHWTDKEALLAHFAVPASGGFVNTVVGLATAEPSMEIYEAERLTL
ncbi:MAG: antibiotic biosynthesis monooxygenase [Actinomycetota bacterium]|nr:antibiotic biosynthesis monooxygenase [Actinomycetota bacterium]